MDTKKNRLRNKKRFFYTANIDIGTHAHAILFNYLFSCNMTLWSGLSLIYTQLLYHNNCLKFQIVRFYPYQMFSLYFYFRYVVLLGARTRTLVCGIIQQRLPFVCIPIWICKLVMWLRCVYQTYQSFQSLAWVPLKLV